uniref:Uncharacterized protein n=1 Tax=Magallana gigas TaxID=29159 RepID=K1QT49_MAGGI
MTSNPHHPLLFLVPKDKLQHFICKNEGLAYSKIKHTAIVKTSTISMLTDDETTNSTSLNLDTLDSTNVDVFRQLLNQETLIRMTLVRNVNALMKDMLTLQEKLTAAENRISKIHTSTDHEISQLKEDVKLLKTENDFLKNNSVHINADIDHLNKNLSDFSNTLTDVKIEVRYLSITLFEINANMRETVKMLQHHNDSMEHIKSDIADKDQKQTAALIEQETRHTKVIEICGAVKFIEGEAEPSLPLTLPTPQISVNSQ